MPQKEATSSPPVATSRSSNNLQQETLQGDTGTDANCWGIFCMRHSSIPDLEMRPLPAQGIMGDETIDMRDICYYLQNVILDAIRGARVPVQAEQIRHQKATGDPSVDALHMALRPRGKRLGGKNVCPIKVEALEQHGYERKQDERGSVLTDKVCGYYRSVMWVAKWRSLRKIFLLQYEGGQTKQTNRFME